MTPEELLALDKAARAALTRVDVSGKQANIGCTRCTRCACCTDCNGCNGCTNCTYCTYCIDCARCADCTYCTRCADCADCAYCVGIIGGRNLRYVVFGVQLTAEQYAAWKAGMR